jgi:hypothetical protein
MKIIFFLISFSCWYNLINAQRISKVTLNGMGITNIITISTDDNAVINISPDGNVVNYGTEYFSEKITNYSRLEQYSGRIDLYTNTDDKLLVGKLKYLGRTPVTYYASYDVEDLRGKIKTIGNVGFNYYMQYDDAVIKGFIKSIGAQQLTYYTSFDNVALKGKLKSLGSTNLSYFNSYDDKAYAGKVKTIGQISFTYYPSYDRQFAGGMKTGNYLQNVAGVNYVIQ